ncbi:uncharacterized protein MELLADRAFT_123237 [Melampsora larici-populina 98AG31]|uniref:PH domain-containing protein n=1 Tax=Melampsora larici-populina (strain 98AG31 / pathotype 3-4-7) TaxID=747676 RepID=F4REX6_MELLP|nr:uncharacterized protein MELLADRAFT_123237 [Melampsora larici-populina 98AG31]EGG09183.1 hypothetical protein MELLADRAFT_123237 [Melampsora larici-populina 98AG31]
MATNQSLSDHQSSSSPFIKQQDCVPHRSNKRKFIGKEAPLIIGDYLIWLSPSIQLTESEKGSLKPSHTIEPINKLQNQTSSPHIKWNQSLAFPSSRLDIFNTPVTKPIKSITTVPTRRPSVLSLRSLKSNHLPSNTIKTWSGSHFEIGADLEEVLKQASLSSNHHDQVQKTQTQRRRSCSSAPSKNKHSISTGVPQRPNGLRRCSSGPFISDRWDIPNSPLGSPSYPPGQLSSPSQTDPPTSSGDSHSAPLAQPVPSPSSEPIPNIQECGLNHNAPTSLDANPTKPMVQVAIDHMGPTQSKPLLKKPLVESVLEAHMLVKFQWTNKHPHRLSLEPTSRISVAEERFKPFKVVLNERCLELYEYSKGVFKNREYSWKLVHSILLIGSDTRFSRPFSSDLAFCLTVNLNYNSLRTHHPSQPKEKPTGSFLSSPIWSKLSNLTHHDQATRKPRVTHLHQRSPHQLAKFIFIPSSKSIGEIMSYELWKRLGGKLPRQVLVDTIGLSSYVQVPIIRSLKAKPMYLSDYELREATMKCLNSNEDYAEMYSRFHSKGRDVRLAWRRKDRLDWISPVPHHIFTGNLPIEQLQIDNAMRGFSVQSTKESAVLELRPALHYPNFVTLSDGSLREEPSGLEGFVTYFKAGGKTGKRVYLSTFDGMLFICKASLAILPKAPVSDDERERLMKVFQPHLPSSQTGLWSTNLTPTCSSHPASPTIANPTSPTQNEPNTLKKQDLNLNVVEEISSSNESHERFPSTKPLESLLTRFYSDELNRQKELVKNSYKFIDMKEIKSIQRSDTILSTQRNPFKPKKKKKSLVEEEVLPGFRIELSEGNWIDLITLNEIETDQWIQHLNELSTYWNSRIQENAKIEMLAMNGTLKPLLKDRDEVGSFDDSNLRRCCSEELQTSLLSSLYHWCIVEGCRTITRSGKLHKKSYKGNTWDTREMILSGGNLIEYSMESKSFDHPHHHYFHHQSKLNQKLYSFDLRLSFVCTAEAAQDQIPHGQIIPGLYSDGLHTNDSLSQCILILWIDSQDLKTQTQTNSNPNPNLNLTLKQNQKQKCEQRGSRQSIRVYKARNQLERDLWIYAIRFEIERSMRMKQSKP